jgi:hypothetical protein
MRFSRPSSAINDASPFFATIPRGDPQRHQVFLSRYLAAFRVSHPLDGLLLASSCRFLSPDKRSWGSPGPSCSHPECSAEALHPLPTPAPEGDTRCSRTLAGSSEHARCFHRITPRCPWAPCGLEAIVHPPLGWPEGLPGGCGTAPLQAGARDREESFTDQVGSAPSIHDERGRSLDGHLGPPALRSAGQASRWLLLWRFRLGSSNPEIGRTSPVQWLQRKRRSQLRWRSMRVASSPRRTHLGPSERARAEALLRSAGCSGPKRPQCQRRTIFATALARPVLRRVASDSPASIPARPKSLELSPPHRPPSLFTRAVPKDGLHVRQRTGEWSGARFLSGQFLLSEDCWPRKTSVCLPSAAKAASGLAAHPPSLHRSVREFPLRGADGYDHGEMPKRLHPRLGSRRSRGVTKELRLPSAGRGRHAQDRSHACYVDRS